METRVERRRKRQQEFRKELLKIPKMLLFLILSLLAYTVSLAFWIRALSGTAFNDYLDIMLRFNILATGFFIIVGHMNFKFLIVIVKSLVKILFTVWVVFIVQFSPIEQTEQSALIIIATSFYVYLEVLLEINNYLFQVKDDFKIPKVNFITAAFIKEHSIAISIFMLSLINVALSYSILNLIEAMEFG